MRTCPKRSRSSERTHIMSRHSRLTARNCLTKERSMTAHRRLPRLRTALHRNRRCRVNRRTPVNYRERHCRIRQAMTPAYMMMSMQKIPLIRVMRIMPQAARVCRRCRKPPRPKSIRVSVSAPKRICTSERTPRMTSMMITMNRARIVRKRLPTPWKMICASRGG